MFTDDCGTCLNGVEESIDVGRAMLKVALRRMPSRGDSCMVCGGISIIGPTELVFIDLVRQKGRRGGLTAQHYIIDLDAHVVPYM